MRKFRGPLGRHPIWVAFLLLLCFLASCGEPDDKSTNLSPSPEVPEGLAAALLLVGDSYLPPGWDVVPSGSDEGISAQESGFCKNPIPDTTGAVETANVQFAKGELTTRLVETLTSYGSAEEATRAFDQLQQVVQTCKEWDLEEEGTRSRFRLSGLEFPNLADQTLGARVDGDLIINADDSAPEPTVPGFVVSENVVARQGEVIIVINHFALGFGERPTLDTAATEPIARRAVEKVMHPG